MDENDYENGDISETELLQIAREEAHRTVDIQIETLDDIDDKAARILRLNLILLGILLSGFSIATTREIVETGGAVLNILNGYLLLGLAAILGSTILAAFTYTASSKRGGMSGRDITELVENDHTTKQNLRGIVESYARWMSYNFKMNTKNAPLGTGMLLFLIYGIILVSVGVFQSFIAATGFPSVVGVLIILGLITWRSGIVNQTRRYLKYRNFEPGKE